MMWRLSILGPLLALAFPTALPASFETGYFDLKVTDASGRVVTRVDIKCPDGRCYQGQSDDQGIAHIRLVGNVRPDWVKISILRRQHGPDWVLLSPWDDRIVVPSDSNSPENVQNVIVVRRHDKQILRQGEALTALTERLVRRALQAADKRVSEAQRMLVLRRQAESFGLTPEEVEQAIREHAKTATDPFTVALVALLDNDLPKAEALFTESYTQRKEAAKISQERALQDAMKFADAAFGLGQTLSEQDKNSEAIEKFKEALSIKKDDVDVLSWLGVSLQAVGRASEAEATYKRAIEISEQTEGGVNMTVRVIYNNLGSLYVGQERYAEAEAAYKRAIEIFEKVGIGKYTSDFSSYRNLAGLYRTQKRFGEAEAVLRRAIEVDKKIVSPNSSYILGSLGDLAEYYYGVGRYVDAEKILLDVIAADEKLTGNERQSLAGHLQNLIDVYNAQGRSRDALRVKERLDKMAVRAPAEGVNDSLHAQIEQALTNLRSARYAEAEAIYNNLIRECEKNCQPNDFAEVLGAAAELYVAWGRYGDAEPLYMRAISLAEKSDDLQKLSGLLSGSADLYARP